MNRIENLTDERDNAWHACPLRLHVVFIADKLIIYYLFKSIRNSTSMDVGAVVAETA